MLDPNEQIKQEDLNEEVLNKEEDHDEVMERFYDDIQQTIW